MNLRACVVSIIVLSGVVSPYAAADELDDKRAEARQIAVEREGLIQTAERLTQRQLEAQSILDRAQVETALAGVELARRQAMTTGLRAELGETVIRRYVLGTTADGLNGLIRDGVSGDSAARDGYTVALVGDQRDLIDRYGAAAEDQLKLRAELALAERRQKEHVTSLERSKAEAAEAERQLAEVESRVTAELKVLVQQEAERQAREAEERARAEAERRANQLAAEQLAARQRAAQQAAAATATTASRQRATTAPTSPRPTATTQGTRPSTTSPRQTATSTRSSATTARPSATTAKAPATTRAQPAPTIPAPVNIPATSPAAAVAVRAALAQLGKPYVFGANGPSTFDCSGLMQWAWAKAGVSMSHYTGTQFNEFPHVPLASVAPGDLVFFNIDLGHVGMYIGNGQYVHAPRTGDVIKISPLSGRNVVGVVRPG